MSGEWVIAAVLRDPTGYFCGCPPCPLCYDWAEYNANPVAGVEKLWEDMKLWAREAGKPEPPREAAQEAADRVHAMNKTRLLGEPEEVVDPAKVDWIERGIALDVAAREGAKAYKPHQPSLDSMDLSKIEKAAEAEAAKKEADAATDRAQKQFDESRRNVREKALAYLKPSASLYNQILPIPATTDGITLYGFGAAPAKPVVEGGAMGADGARYEWGRNADGNYYIQRTGERGTNYIDRVLFPDKAARDLHLREKCGIFAIV